MPAKDLGTKFICFKCSTKFYDLKKPSPVCPKCGADQRESPALKPTPSRKAREKEPVAPVEPEATEEAAEEAEAEAGEADEDEDEDAGDDEGEDDA